MPSYTWKEYYEKFYDWAESTEIRNLSCLTSLGDADEVGEVILELSSSPAAANRLLRRANEAGLQFNCHDLTWFSLDLDETEVKKALLQSVPRLKAEDMEELASCFDEETVRQVCKKGGFPIPPELEEELDDTPGGFAEEMPRHGFFGALFGALCLGRGRKPHAGVCDGDCAHCPPHYGYRYGRWYYGHGHQYGCEFGGNKGDGGL